MVVAAVASAASVAAAEAVVMEAGIGVEKVHGLRRSQDGLQAVRVEVVHDGWKIAHGVVQEGEGIHLRHVQPAVHRHHV